MLGSQGFVLILVLVGLFNGVQPQYQDGAQVGAQVRVTVTPTLTETVFDVLTTVINVDETRTVTRSQTIDVINTEYVDIPITFQQTFTRRSFTPVAGQVTTSDVKVTNIQVSISTNVIPVASTTEFVSTRTVFVTRRDQVVTQNSLIIHTKCDNIEIEIVPTFITAVVTQTLVVQQTTYIYSTITSTQFITNRRY